MPNKFTFAAIAMSLFATPALAQEDDKGFYVGLTGGLADVQKVGLSGTIDVDDGEGGFTEETVTGDLGSESSGVITGTVGYDFGLIRADLEVSYARTRISSVAITSVGGTAITSLETTGLTAADICGEFTESASCTVSGNRVSFDGGAKVRQLNALVNVWVDIPVGAGFHPYVGGGLGIAGVESEGEGKGKFAWQLGAGVAVDITPGIALTADFRHRQSDRIGDAFDLGADLGRVKTNSFSAGVRFRF